MLTWLLALLLALSVPGQPGKSATCHGPKTGTTTVQPFDTAGGAPFAPITDDTGGGAPFGPITDDNAGGAPFASTTCKR